MYVQASAPDLETLSIETQEYGAESWNTVTGQPIDGTSHRYFRVSDRYSEETNGLRLRYRLASGGFMPDEAGQLFTEGTYTLLADGSARPGKPADVVVTATLHYFTEDWSEACLHYRVDENAWTNAPGAPMQAAGPGWFAHTLDMDGGEAVEFVPNNCAGSWDNNGGRNYRVNSGTWRLKSGTITEGAPDTNAPPTAVITPGDLLVEKGAVVTLSAVDSSDPDGRIAGYRCSTGETTPSIAATVNETQTVSVTVTDDKQATASASVSLTVPGQSNFASFYFRGTANGWCATPMALVADDTWQVVIDFGQATDQRFKFDVAGDWSHHYGDNDADGILDKHGAHIRTDVTGHHRVELNSNRMNFRLIPTPQ